MLKIEKDVYVNGVKVGTIELVYDDNQVSFSRTSGEPAEITRLNLTIVEAETIYDLMTLAHAGYKNQPKSSQ